MRRTELQTKGIKALAALFVAVAEALAQEQEQAAIRRIVVSIPDRKLALLADGHVVRVYPTAVGAPRTPSPSGTFEIIDRIPNPTWYQPGKVVRPGKANPLGTRWIGLSHKGYGIHGTNNPRSIGQSASHGCIRMRNRDVEELFDLVERGDVVELYGERNELTEQIFGPGPVTVAALAGVQ